MMRTQGVESDIFYFLISLNTEITEYLGMGVPNVIKH